MDMSVADFDKIGLSRIIRYRGIFDFDALYKFMVRWIKEKDFDFYENRILEKPPYRIHKLEGRKKVTYYVMFRLLPEIWLWEAKPVEIIRNGRTKTLTEGRAKIVINGGVIYDYDGDFEGTPNKKKLEAFLNTQILYHENFLKYLDYMDYYLYGFMNEVKQYLEMETATNAY